MLSLMFRLFLLVTALFSATLHAAEEKNQPKNIIQQADVLISQDKNQAAMSLLRQGTIDHSKSLSLLTAAANHAFNSGLLGEAERFCQQGQAIGANPALETIADMTAKRLTKLSSHQKLAIISTQKYSEGGDYLSAISVARKAILNWPKNDQLYALLGEAQYRSNNLEAAEISLRQSLKLNPLNEVSKNYINEIRTTENAQISEESQEWMSIAKDKVGDFIVTFLALFAAFLTNSLIAPVLLQVKLNRARRSFERGDYDDFTDLLEGLLDLENFAPIRSNFQFILRQKSLDEAKQVLNKHVVTLDRLPTLLRILDREYERKLESDAA